MSCLYLNMLNYIKIIIIKKTFKILFFLHVLHGKLLFLKIGHVDMYLCGFRQSFFLLKYSFLMIKIKLEPKNLVWKRNLMVHTKQY